MIMANISEYIECDHCKQTARKKYHNTVYSSCGNCNRDSYDDQIYTCGSCGVSEPSNRMETEMLCQSCWAVEIRD